MNYDFGEHRRADARFRKGKTMTINLLDSVVVTPTEHSAFAIREYAGRQGTVYARAEENLAVIFDRGVRLCLLPSEVRRVNGWDDRVQENMRLVRKATR